VSAGWKERALREVVGRALAEDLAGYGDLTGDGFGDRGRARVEARERGVLSGSAAFICAARLVDKALEVDFAVADAASFAAGETLATLVGPLCSILACERTALNFLSRLSGVATLTARFVAETAGTKAAIAATRKTTPGLRALEKAAVLHGGGRPHRFGLFDAAMIKDNHIAAAGGVTPAIEAVRARLAHAHGLIVEVDTLAQLDEALAVGVPAVLLDNMDVATVKRAVEHVAGRAVVEASGGVRLEDVRPLAEAGVDVISVGALTTKAPWIDLSLVVGD
jgi:nicotinate-nucleotide pyrophosphorylase (carboxylating)